ncbi:MAG: hypothetical protein AAF806_23120 [Bacteroidota bacterium]
MKIKHIALVSLIFIGLSNLTAQRIDYPSELLEKLSQMSLEIVEPTESSYRDVWVLKNEVYSYDFAIRSRKEKLEIRYILRTANPNNPLSAFPDIEFLRLVTQLASNDGAASPMAFHEVEPQELEEVFQADWGKYVFFQPKGSFAQWPHAKLLSLYKTNHGLVHILFLYKKPSIDLDNRFYAVRFLAHR